MESLTDCLSTFLVLSKEPWTEVRRARKQLLFEALLSQPGVQEVLYVNPPRHIWQECHAGDNMPAHMHSRQNTFLLPGERFSWMRQVNRWYMYHGMKAKIGRKQWCSVFYHPWDTAFVPYLKRHGPVLFDWTDDWGKFHQSSEMALFQDKALRSATFVIAVTESLAERAAKIRGTDKDVLLLPNATAMPLYMPASMSSPPPDIASIPSPRIGYIGHMGPWFDGNLVEQLAKRNHSWQWVLIGSAVEEVKARFASISNVHLLGPKPYVELQEYLAQCQVLVAPYRKSVQLDASKLYDYLTVNRPIISSDIATARRLAEHLLIAETIEQWEEKIHKALGSPLPHLMSRQEIVRTCSWENRAHTLLEWLIPRMVSI